MRYILNVVIACLWGLWLGGTAATFVFAPYFFHKLDPDVARPAANAMFIVFGKYELILAGLALLLTGVQVVTAPNKPLLLFLLTLVAAGGLGVMTALGFMPIMESLRSQGKTDSIEFQRLHHKSVIAMTTQEAVLLVGGALLIVMVRRPVAKSQREE